MRVSSTAQSCLCRFPVLDVYHTLICEHHGGYQSTRRRRSRIQISKTISCQASFFLGQNQAKQSLSSSHVCRFDGTAGTTERGTETSALRATGRRMTAVVFRQDTSEVPGRGHCWVSLVSLGITARSSKLDDGDMMPKCPVLDG